MNTRRANELPPPDPLGRPQWWQGLGIGFDEIMVAAVRSANIRGSDEIVHRHRATTICPGGCVLVAPDGFTGAFP